jgi:hypothetical protein
MFKKIINSLYDWSNKPQSVNYRSRMAKDEFNLQTNFFTLKVHSGIGGTAIQYSKYNESEDDMIHHLHIIPDDADLCDALSKIITFESLR